MDLGNDEGHSLGKIGTAALAAECGEWKKEEIKRTVKNKSNWSWTRKDSRIKIVGWGLICWEDNVPRRKEQRRFGWTSESQFCLLLFWILVLPRRQISLYFWGSVCLGKSFLCLIWRPQRWKATKGKDFLENSLQVILICTRKIAAEEIFFCRISVM